MSLYWKRDMTFEEANRKVKEHIAEYDDIDILDYDVEDAFGIISFTGDECTVCDHREECALGKFRKEYEYEPVAKCNFWEYNW